MSENGVAVSFGERSAVFGEVKSHVERTEYAEILPIETLDEDLLIY